MSEAFTRRYRLLDRLAIGGTAEVFRAVFVGSHGGGEKPVVIKRVLPQLARDQRFRRLFFEEACLAATLSHPNVVKVLDYGDLGDTCFIAMEPIDGQDLESLLAAARQRPDPRPMPAPLAALVAADVGEALQFIHQHTSSEGLPLKIIHRDVSPHNILVSYQGHVKLTDFGIAKSVIRREHTVDGAIRGKLDYMAPEQALPDQQVDHRADLFALGCVLFEMLHGKPPLRGSNEIDTIQRIRDLRMDVPPEQLDAPAPLRELLARLLRASPSERFDQAGEMVRALRAYLESCPSPPNRADLASWVAGLRDGGRAASGERSVDDAVRALLGDSPADAPEAPIRVEGSARPANTSVFALPAEQRIRGTAAQRSAASPDGDKPVWQSQTARSTTLPLVQWRVVLPLAAFGLLGWILWGLRIADDGLERGDDHPTTPRADRASGASPPNPAKTTGRPGKNIRSFTRPARHPREASRPAPAAASRREVGYLTVNSLPWSRVYVDGHYAGNTPIVRQEASAGERLVQLRGPDGRLRKSLRITLRPGQTGRYTFDFRNPAQEGGTR